MNSSTIIMLFYTLLQLVIFAPILILRRNMLHLSLLISATPKPIYEVIIKPLITWLRHAVSRTLLIRQNASHSLRASGRPTLILYTGN